MTGFQLFGLNYEFPQRAIDCCLRMGGIRGEELDQCHLSDFTRVVLSQAKHLDYVLSILRRAQREKVNSMFRLTLQLSFFLCIGIILFARFPPMLVLRPSILGCLKHVLLTPTGVDELFLE